MESNSLLSKEETSLLTLARKDLSSKQDPNQDKLVLMQMPPGLNVKDVKGARIIAAPSQQACLVLESKGMTYSMSRVETSNAYILVPPASDNNATERPRKKTKTDATLVSVEARLLQPGGSGASFIELKKKSLHIGDLQQELKEHVFDPYDESKEWTGRTLSSLAVSLQTSAPEVLDGLQRMQALRITTSDGGSTAFGLLSEEALQEAKTLIVATLTECDEFADYAGTGVKEKECIKQVMDRVASGESYAHMADVIKHTLRTLESDDDSDDLLDDGDMIQLDLKKVAVCVVHRLFSKQSEPWEEQELLSQWQREMPGVGDKYQVSLSMLSGVALLDTTTKKWKYFPEEKLPADLGKRFQVIFGEGGREKWTLEELKPYVKRLTTSELSETDLLLHHTSMLTEDVDGKPTKLYVSKH